MKRIYKYELGRGPGEVRTLMPEGARVLTAQWQAGAIVAWAVIDDEATGSEEIRFRIVWTGHECAFIDDGGAWAHAGTVQDPDGLVLHVFYRLRDIFLPKREQREAKAGGGA